MLPTASWIMQFSAHPKKMKFDLEAALQEALHRDRTIWLTNAQFGDLMVRGERVYLWSSGIVSADGQYGRLIAVARVAETPRPHAQYDWQATYRRSAKYNPDVERVKLTIEALVTPPILPSEILQLLPAAPGTTVFFRAGHFETTTPVEPHLEEVLSSLIATRTPTT